MAFQSDSVMSDLDGGPDSSCWMSGIGGWSLPPWGNGGLERRVHLIIAAGHNFCHARTLSCFVTKNNCSAVTF